MPTNSIPSGSSPSTIVGAPQVSPPIVITAPRVDTSQPSIQDEETSRKPYPQFNPFRSWVMDELILRKTTYPTPTKSPFVRLTSCKEDPGTNNKYSGYRFFTLGLHGFGKEDINIFDQTYGTGTDIIGYAYDTTTGKKRLIHTDELTQGDLPQSIANLPNVGNIQQVQKQELDLANTVFAKGTHPIPGIVDVTVERYGVGVPFVTSVKWVCYNRAQLEFLRHHFLQAGGFVVIEWGHNFSDRQISKTLPFSDKETVLTELKNSIDKGRSYVLSNWVKPNDGNYDFIVGRVGNFSIGLDAKHNIYECVTKIYSVGEPLWGLNSFATFVNTRNKNAPSSPPSPTTGRGQGAGSGIAQQPFNDGRIQGGVNPKVSSGGALDVDSNPSSFHDFFEYGRAFDVLINNAIKDPSTNYVSKFVTDWSKNNSDKLTVDLKTKDNKIITVNPEDYRFISWEFFITVILPEMYKILENDSSVNNNLSKYMSFYSDPGDTSDTSDWVGDNNAALLKSTDPDTMLVIKSWMTVPAELSTIGKFDTIPNNNGGTRGKLSSGVWLNAHVVRESFRGTNMFQQGMYTLLSRMNNAYNNYWNLQLFFDEDTNKYKIIDMAHMTAVNAGSTSGNVSISSNNSSFYKFNFKTRGEALDIKLDSAYPPELVTQLALFEKFRTEPIKTQEDLLRTYPKIGTTSTFVFSLNWTNLEDLLEKSLQFKVDPLSAEQQSIYGITPDTTKKDTGSLEMNTISRISEANTSNAGSFALVSNTSLDNPGRSSGAPPVDNIRNSPFPITNPADAKLLSGAALYNTSIEKWASYYSNLRDIIIPSNLIRGQIAHESQFDLHAVGSLGERGLMQLRPEIFVPIASKLLQRSVDASELETNTDLNIRLGTAFLADNIVSAGNADPTIPIEGGLSAYNGGFNSNAYAGYGKILPGSTPPRFTNQGYVNAVITNFNKFNKLTGKPIFVGKTTQGTDLKPQQTAAVLSGDASVAKLSEASQNDESSIISATEIASINSAQETVDDIKLRFGNPIIPLIELTPSVMKARVTQDGYLKYPKPNSFVAPFPTTTAISLDIVGIGGLSVSDAFYVDKLPFIFEQYGAFQITRITEKITPDGWITTVNGYFKLIWLLGEGASATPIG